MANKVFVNKVGYIEDVIDGDQDKKSWEEMLVKHRLLVKRMSHEDKKAEIKVIVDATNMGSLSLEAIRTASQGVRVGVYDFVAVFGVDKLKSGLINLIIGNKGASNIKLFSGRADAEAWLAKNKSV